MEATRRDFLGAMACAFAAAKLPCRIPPEVTAPISEAAIGWVILPNGIKISWDISRNNLIWFGTAIEKISDKLEVY